MRDRLIVLVLLAALAACGAYAPAADPCDQHANSAGCRLYNAQLSATLQAGDATTAAQEAQARIDATKRAIDLAQTERLGRLAAQQTQDASILNATRQMQYLQATGTSIAQSIKATATAQAVQAQQTRDALAIERTQTAIAIARLQTATKEADNVNGTSTAIAVQATADAALVEKNRQETEAALAGVKELVMTVLFIGLCLGLTVIVVKLGYRVFKNLAHFVDVRASTIRVGPNNQRAIIVTQAGDVIDPHQIVGAHMTTAGHRQPIDARTVEDFMAWAMTLEHARREQLVRIAEAVGVFPKSDAPALLSGPTQPDAASSLIPQPSSLPTAPPFAQLLARWRPSQTQMLLGYGAGGPIYGGLGNLLSVAIIGRPNQGKSTLLRCVYLQCRIVGAEVIVWDLHGSIVDDLPGAAAYLTVADIQRSAKFVEHELSRRIDNHLRAERPLMLLLDEAPILFQSLPDALAIASRIVLEGRKFQMFALIASQGMPASLFNGSLVRDAFSSRYAFQTTMDQARLIGFDKEHARLVEDLPPGVALLNGPVRTQAVAIPDTTEADVKIFFTTSAISGSGPEVAPGSGRAQTGSGVGSGPEVAGEVALEVDDFKREQVRQLLKAQTPVSTIVEQLWGVKRGRPYIKAAEELRAIMATLV